MNKQTLARISIVSVIMFCLLLVLLHFIEPEFNPSKNLISEYELGNYGWVMSLAFFSLGIGTFTMLLSTIHQSSNLKYHIGRWWYVIIGVAFIGAGIFYPYVPTNTASIIHGICGIIIIATFPVAATIYSAGLKSIPDWFSLRRRLTWATLLVWIGLITFMGSTIILGIITQPVGRTSAYLAIGWQNRFMIITYGIWIIVVNIQNAFKSR